MCVDDDTVMITSTDVSSESISFTRLDFFSHLVHFVTKRTCSATSALLLFRQTFRRSISRSAAFSDSKPLSHVHRRYLLSLVVILMELRKNDDFTSDDITRDALNKTLVRLNA